MPGDYGYKLTLTVQDHGTRTFDAQSGAAVKTQAIMHRFLAWDIARSLQILNDPPTAASLALAIDGHSGKSPVAAVARLCELWTGETSTAFDFLEVTVRLDNLLGDEPRGVDIAAAIQFLNRVGWKYRTTPDLDKILEEWLSDLPKPPDPE